MLKYLTLLEDRKGSRWKVAAVLVDLPTVLKLGRNLVFGKLSCLLLLLEAHQKAQK